MLLPLVQCRHAPQDPTARAKRKQSREPPSVDAGPTFCSKYKRRPTPTMTTSTRSTTGNRTQPHPGCFAQRRLRLMLLAVLALTVPPGSSVPGALLVSAGSGSREPSAVDHPISEPQTPSAFAATGDAATEHHIADEADSGAEASGSIYAVDSSATSGLVPSAGGVADEAAVNAVVGHMVEEAIGAAVHDELDDDVYEVVDNEAGGELGHGCHSCGCLPACKHGRCNIARPCHTALCTGHCKWPSHSTRGTPIRGCRLGKCSRLNQAWNLRYSQTLRADPSDETVAA